MCCFSKPSWSIGLNRNGRMFITVYRCGVVARRIAECCCARNAYKHDSLWSQFVHSIIRIVHSRPLENRRPSVDSLPRRSMECRSYSDTNVQRSTTQASIGDQNDNAIKQKSLIVHVWHNLIFARCEEIEVVKMAHRICAKGTIWQFDFAAVGFDDDHERSRYCF